MRLRCTLYRTISRYLSLSHNAPILWRIFATANGTDAGSESRSKIYFDYAEQQGGKDDEVGLKRKTIHPLRFARRPCLRGTVSYNRLVATPITSILLTL